MGITQIWRGNAVVLGVPQSTWDFCIVAFGTVSLQTGARFFFAFPFFIPGSGRGNSSVGGGRLFCDLEKTSCDGGEE